MNKKFSDYMAEVDARSTDDQRAVATAFDAHYKMVYLEHFGLGDQLAATRKAAHLTQEQLAERSGVPQPEISRIEHGQGNPTKDTLAKLGDALGLMLSYVSADHQQGTPA
jgi:ribosome-binding protein aMBF1 (putative translation factor)